MYKQNFVASVLWSLMPVAMAFRALGHAVMWLGMVCLRKLFQLKYDTGFAAAVLVERGQLASALMCASFVLFRMRIAFAALGLGRKAARTERPAVSPQPQEQ